MAIRHWGGEAHSSPYVVTYNWVMGMHACILLGKLMLDGKTGDRQVGLVHFDLSARKWPRVRSWPRIRIPWEAYLRWRNRAQTGGIDALSPVSHPSRPESEISCSTVFLTQATHVSNYENLLNRQSWQEINALCPHLVEGGLVYLLFDTMYGWGLLCTVRT